MCFSNICSLLAFSNFLFDQRCGNAFQVGRNVVEHFADIDFLKAVHWHFVSVLTASVSYLLEILRLSGILQEINICGVLENDSKMLWRII